MTVACSSARPTDRQGWQLVCGAVATHIEVAEIDVAYAIASCVTHHNPSAVPIGDQSEDALRQLFRDAGVTRAF
jgi:hypothetical protein